METVSLIVADILLLMLIIAGAYVERRVSRLEFGRTKDLARARELRREVELLRQSIEDAEEDDVTDIETWKAKDAERKFTEGVASILNYGLQAAQKEAEHSENTGA